MQTVDYDRDQIFADIEKMIQENDVVVYMKGSADMPMCGFSSFVVQVLKSYNITFRTINVLDSNELRQAIKDYNSWPTIPQVFIKGEFIGGCDIIKDMHETGELKELLSPLP